MMSDQNMLSLDCSSEHCNFRTPLLGREQYQAMVAHLQVHSALAHGAALPPTPWAASNADETGRGYGSCNAAGCVDGSEDASSLRSRSRSRRRDRTFRCTDCSDRAYETEKGLKYHKLRYCGKPREEGVFPCTVCDKEFMNVGLLKMHTGRFHTERSALRVEGSHGQENVDKRCEGDASISTSKERGGNTTRESTFNVGERNGELPRNNQDEDQRMRNSEARSSSSFGFCGVRGMKTSTVQKSGGVGMNALVQGSQTPGEVATSSSVKGRSESPANSMWSDSSSTMQGMKSLVIVEMVMQNIVTRVTYRVTSTLPIGMILPKVAAKLGTDERKIQLRMGKVAIGGDCEVPGRVSKDRGLVVDVMDNAEDFNNKVIHAVVVA